MPQLKNPVTNQVVSVAAGQEQPYLDYNWTVVQEISTPGFNNPNSITPESLASVNPINLNPQPQDTTNYNGIISGGLESANAALARANKPPIASEPNSIESMLTSLTGGTPPSSASLYESTYGVGPTQEEISLKQETERKAQQDLDLLNAEMRALNAEAKAAPIQTQEEAKGRGIVKAATAITDTGKLRNIALRSLPLEGQILAQQAVLTGSQRALQLAQSKFDKVFELRMADQDRTYDYMKEQRKMIYDTLTRKEQQQIDAMNKADDIKREEYKANSLQAQKLSQDALDNGQADIAAKITALDPKSITFIADLAKLQGQITIKQEEFGTPYKIGEDFYQKNTKTGEIRKMAEGEKPITQTIGNKLYQYDTATKTWKEVVEGPEDLKKVTINGVDYMQKADGTIIKADVPLATSQEKIDKSTKVIDAVNQLLGSEYTFIVGSVGGRIPEIAMGGESYNALTYFNNLKSLLTLDNMGLMKGVLSDSDIKILTSAATPLNRRMTPEAFKKEVEKIKFAAKSIMNSDNLQIGQVMDNEDGTYSYKNLDGTTRTGKMGDNYKDTTTPILNLDFSLVGGDTNKAVSLITEKIGDKNITIDSRIGNRLAMADKEFFDKTGKHLQVNQSYRTTTQQAKLYSELSSKGARVAPPGKSFHEKGLAVDITNWKEAESILRKYGFKNNLADDKGHFSIGEFA